MDTSNLLRLNWEICYDKEDWFLPVADALKGLTAEQAHWRPEGGPVNTIWETLNHLIFYKERMLKRMMGEETAYPEGVTNEDTFKVESTGEEAWAETVQHSHDVHLAIRERIAGLKDDDWENAAPGRRLDQWLNSLALHDAHHAGQIVLLRKLQGSWPAQRS
ncbi:DinB family protein [Cohnella lubricantis]|uniref:DinB family protein n=1 Tax=Cohnella lubricantis TaxID=2163172 RepID=A0A841TGX2_9BACL|nr:DinB family protein [Cohnella lubricantis]MBB6678197.1 DinB family protein [Cohnella lubricantis]MBP2119676.1 putative damage-inducible protein DinB [Cohnella lubricantis]